ncbi:hypothetical protein DD607_30125, partial [Salmonella sp. 3DZ2-4SM]
MSHSSPLPHRSSGTRAAAAGPVRTDSGAAPALPAAAGAGLANTQDSPATAANGQDRAVRAGHNGRRRVHSGRGGFHNGRNRQLKEERRNTLQASHRAILSFWHRVEFFIPYDLQGQVLESKDADWSVRQLSRDQLERLDPKDLWSPPL